MTPTTEEKQRTTIKIKIFQEKTGLSHCLAKDFISSGINKRTNNCSIYVNINFKFETNWSLEKAHLLIYSTEKISHCPNGQISRRWLAYSKLDQITCPQGHYCISCSQVSSPHPPGYLILLWNIDIITIPLKHVFGSYSVISLDPKIWGIIGLGEARSMLYDVSPARFGRYRSCECAGFRKSSSTICLDLALIATWRHVSPFLSATDTFARLSSKSDTISTFLFRTAFINGVSPSWNFQSYYSTISCFHSWDFYLRS